MNCFQIAHPREAVHGVSHAAEHDPEPDAVSDWERQHLMKHS